MAESRGKTEKSTAYNYSYREMVNKVIGNTTIGELLFDQTLEEPGGNGGEKSYWLASPGVLVYSPYVFFGPGVVYGGDIGSGLNMFSNYGAWSTVKMGVRPIISIKTDITLEEIGITEGEEERWIDVPGDVESGIIGH